MTSLILPTYSRPRLAALQRASHRDRRHAGSRAGGRLPDRDLPAALAISAAPGDPAVLTLDNGEQDAPVFAGTIEAIHRSFGVTRVRALDAGGLLARVVPRSRTNRLGRRGGAGACVARRE